ncbi:Kinesin, putative [Hondaea fermentalgiana]|uniref:Kinesin, putative n=1 Tax=Hondaea fermentalgiana TaxID=2315210 RepID=A0A2R5G3E1_9STRA|nr:Kinesin, putative [Hondaea fermentalgiana]|eukprot:GBG24839.1 Kinesin, putative [Hondaea fermentalgiana]
MATSGPWPRGFVDDEDNEDAARIHVAARFRPRLGKSFAEKAQSRWRREQSLSLIHDGQRRFLFDHVFGSTHCNAEVSSKVGVRIVEKVLDGYNGTIFAYGQSGSGKTHTMSASGGLVEFCVMALFSGVARLKAASHICVSSWEVHNERIIDLFADESSHEGDEGDEDLRGATRDQTLRIRGDDCIKGSPTIEGLQEFQVHSSRETLGLLASADARRHWRETSSGPRSSRSHTFVRLSVHEPAPEGGAPSASSLLLVDLAASERSGQAEGEALLEGSHMNRSLLALREVVSSLTASQLQQQYVPYRNSLLTRILRQSLGGNAFTSIICTASDAAEDDLETETTLVFGSLCRRISTAPVRTREDTDSLPLPFRHQEVRANNVGEEEEDEEEEEEEEAKATSEGRNAARRRAKSARQTSSPRAARSQNLQEGEGNSEISEGELAYSSDNSDRSDARLVARGEDDEGEQGDDEESLSSQEATERPVGGKQRRESIFSVEPHADADHRLQDIKSWEREMRQWYVDSVEYNEETQERAQLVEAAAVRVDKERRDRAMSLARREAVFVADMRRRRSELDSMKMQLERAEQDVLTRRETLLLRENAARALEHSLQRWQARLEAKETDIETLQAKVAALGQERDEARAALELEKQRATAPSKARRKSAPALGIVSFGFDDELDEIASLPLSDMSPTCAIGASSPHRAGSGTTTIRVPCKLPEDEEEVIARMGQGKKKKKQTLSPSSTETYGDSTRGVQDSVKEAEEHVEQDNNDVEDGGASEEDSNLGIEDDVQSQEADSTFHSPGPHSHWSLP